MRIYLPFDFDINPRVFIRRAGYAEFNDPNTGIASYTKRLDRDYYPRFHLYIEQDKDNKKYFNLHLDQKKPSYAGSSAHNAEYEGGIVEKEGERIANLIKNQIDNQKQSVTPTKKNFWEKFFG